MSLLFEVILYIVLVFAIILVSMTFFETSMLDKTKYIRVKKDDVKINVKVYYEGLTEQEIEQVNNVIFTGKYDNIYDIVDKYEIVQN